MRTVARYLLVVVAFCLVSAAAHAQSATGTLTVSFTVEPSSTIVFMPDGKLQDYVANPPTITDARPIYFPPTAADTQSAHEKHDGTRPKAVGVPKKKA